MAMAGSSHSGTRCARPLRHICRPSSRAPDVAIEIAPDGGGCRIAVEARSFVKDLCIFADRLDPAASVDEMLVTLLPGQRRVFSIQGVSSDLPGRMLASPPVLRCANDLVGKRMQMNWP